MKITFICAVFPPEPAPAGVMAEQLATRLTRDGHDVAMIVPFPNRPGGVIYPGFRRRLRSREISSQTYTVVRCANWLIGKRRRTIDRLLENITFGLSSMWAALREGRPDLLIIEQWPLFAPTFGALLARAWGIPYLYYVQDIFPESAQEAGMLNPGGIVARVFRAWDRWLCAHSAGTIAISGAMKQLLVKNRALPEKQVTVIPNWMDQTAFPVCDRDTTWRKSVGITDETFVALFAGTLGHVCGAEILVEAAHSLQREEKLLLLCIGEGVKKQLMIDGAQRLGLNNIKFLSFQPKEQVAQIQSSCQVALLTVHPNHSDTSVPSKLISYLAASCPVVCSAPLDSTVAQTVLDAEAGVVVPPGDGQALANAIVRLRNDPSTLRQMGTNARRYFEEHLTLDRAHRQFRQLISQTLSSPAPARQATHTENHLPPAVHED